MDPAGHPDPTLSERLASHIAGTPHEAIPAAVRQTAKLFALDTLAVAWAGSDAPGCPAVRDLLVSQGGSPESTVWAFGDRLPAGAAAFVNGMSAAALDYDCLGRDAPAHVGIVVYPAALAVAERVHATGEEFIAAVVLGADVMCRLAAGTLPPHRGFHYTSTFGTFGAAAAAARLLRLSVEQTAHALGLAFVQACGTQQTNIDPSLGKRMLSAFAARAGVDAAMLARAGITAPRESIEGAFGLYRLYQEGDPERLLAGLGTDFASGNLSIKKFPSCGCNHTAIAATLDLAALHDLDASQVESIEVTVSPYIDRISGMPYDPSRDPQVAAQFSIRYSIACALVRRRLGLAEIQADAARDPAINQVVPRVSVNVDPGFTGDRGPIELRMRTRDGRELFRRIDHVPGSVENPLSAEEVDAKHAECFGIGVRPLRPEQYRRLKGRIMGVEQCTDMATLLTRLGD